MYLWVITMVVVVMVSGGVALGRSLAKLLRFEGGVLIL